MNNTRLILPCLRGVMGDWVYYSTLMTVEQISHWIKTAKDIREAKSLDEELQRDLKERKKKIAEYLQKDESRFFNSIIVGIFEGVPDWREFDLSKPKAEFSAQFDSEYFKESLGLMVFNGDEKMFAIDGQHRVAGIQLAYQQELKKEPSSRSLTDDQYSIIFVAHIDNPAGMKRTRKLFSDINKNAKPVAKKDKIIIDEQDICAIVTRRVMAESEYFDNGKLISLSETTNLDSDDKTNFTNISNLYDVVKILRRNFKLPINTYEWDEANIQRLKIEVFAFLKDIFTIIDEYRIYFIDKTKSLLELRDNNSYLLFRPVGFLLIAKLYVDFQKRNDLETFFANVNRVSFVFPISPFNKVVWNNGKMETKSVNQTLAFDLFLFLVGAYPDEKEESLRKRYRDVTKNDSLNLPNKIGEQEI